MTQTVKRNTQPPPFKGGLDWDGIHKAYRARLEEQAAAGIESSIKELAALMEAENRRLGIKPKEEPKPKVRKKPGPPKGSPKVGVPRPTYDHRLVKHMYLDKKMRIGEIAKELGAHRGTIHRILGPVLPQGGEKGGPRRQDECQKGHPMTEENTYPASTGGRGCRVCKRERDRKAYHAKAARDRAQQAA